MDVFQTHGHPILILGAGRGGTAMIEMLAGEPLVRLVGIVDTNPQAPGLALAGTHGVRVFTDYKKALTDCAPCLAFNLTHDDSVTEQAAHILGANSIIGGIEARLIWQMVTKLKKTGMDLKESTDYMQAILTTVLEGIITINAKCEIRSFNPAAEKIFGYSRQQVIGHNVNMLMPEPDHSQHNGYVKKYLETGEEKIIGVGDREVMGKRKDGSTFPMNLSVSEILFDDQHAFVGTIRDITERKLAEEKIRLMAHYDQLTGLPNRSLFFDRLEQSLVQAKRHKQKVATLFLDLDGFKPINDTYGHDAGDQLLQEVARRLLGCVREADTVARIGGDEFIILLAEVAEAKNAAQVAEKILASLAGPVALNNAECKIGGSIGIALFPDDAEDGETLLKNADNGMYLAKSEGKNTFRFYQGTTAKQED